MERQRALPTFGIGHAMHADGAAGVDVVHVLGRDEDVLLALGRVCGVNL